MEICNKIVLQSFHLDPKDSYQLVQKFNFMTPLSDPCCSDISISSSVSFYFLPGRSDERNWTEWLF